jgi:hypothetical protein
MERIQHRWLWVLALAVAAAPVALAEDPPAPKEDEPSASDVLKQLAPKEGEIRRPPPEPPAAAAAPGANEPERPAAPPPPLVATEPRQEPSSSEVLEQLRSRDGAMQPIVRPNLPGARRSETLSPEAMPRNAIVPVSTRLIPDGHRVVDRPGRLQREGDFWVFAFESRSTQQAEPPLRLLPNRALEDMEIASAGGTRAMVFLVSGEVTEYHGVNYLLIQKMLVRPNLGNLK